MLFGCVLTAAISTVSLVVKEPWKMFETADAFVSGDGRTSRFCTVAE